MSLSQLKYSHVQCVIETVPVIKEKKKKQAPLKARVKRTFTFFFTEAVFNNYYKN